MIKILKNLTLKDCLMLLIGILFIYGEVWLDLRIPDYMAKITTLVQTPGSDIKEILINGSYMLLCALICMAFAVIVGLIIAKVSSTITNSSFVGIIKILTRESGAEISHSPASKRAKAASFFAGSSLIPNSSNPSQNLPRR